MSETGNHPSSQRNLRGRVSAAGLALALGSAGLGVVLFYALVIR